ncbi:hypothetical protein [Amycolatopsis lurida]|uniref:hypothetical protein n=1 Tax=Amycolatopsis lurida TaxID=31959 RepID=UPI00364ACA6B
MASRPIVPLASAAGSAGLLAVLPLWCAIALVTIGSALTASRVIVTQIIRLRAADKITTSEHTLRLLEIEDDSRRISSRSERRANPSRHSEGVIAPER